MFWDQEAPALVHLWFCNNPSNQKTGRATVRTPRSIRCIFKGSMTSADVPEEVSTTEVHLLSGDLTQPTVVS